MKKLKKTHLLTGGNLGDRRANLLEAKRLVAENIGEIVKSSSLYETQAWGVEGQPDYFNQALEVLTLLSPADLLAAVIAIERQVGRVRRSKWEARPIDIDILFYENKILKTKDLTIPHPLLHRRNFALVPLLEIAPNKRHPVFFKTVEELYEESPDTLDVAVLDENDPAEK